MRKEFRNSLLVLLLVLSLFTTLGCSKKSNIDSKVIGTWEHNDEALKAIYVLKKDGTGSYTMTVGENTVEKKVDYYTKVGQLFINYDKDPDTFELEYSIKNNSLVIIDSLNEEVVYKKK